MVNTNLQDGQSEVEFDSGAAQLVLFYFISHEWVLEQLALLKIDFDSLDLPSLSWTLTLTGFKLNLINPAPTNTTDLQSGLVVNFK